VKLDADQAAQVERARGLVEGAAVLLNAASATLRRVHERHPLFYRTNAALRDVDELQTELRREADQQ